ncbi:MAG: GntR family transcriptional regulator [Actinomycetia bacterium]|nr:GntR family transcriptional regulator [Actinomycetes bacterium]
MGEHGPQSGIIGTVMTVPINNELAPASPPAISPEALADLLGRWPTADGALYRLLAARMGRLADTGELPAGVRLPPERSLAAALSVSRNTVALAYQVLRDEGMAASRQGSGTRLVPHRTTPAAVHRANGFFTGLLSAPPDFDLSLAAVDCAPQVAAALHDPATVLDEPQRMRLTRGTGYYPYGLPELRAAIASMLTTFHGIPTTADQVLVTTGGQQALDLLLRCEVAPGHPVATDNPTYPGFIDALYRSGARPVGVPPGDMGRLADAVTVHQPALAYLTPTHHNPTGLVLPAAERHEIVALARRHPGVTFIDDMTLAELPLGTGAFSAGPNTGGFSTGPQPPPLAALAPRLPNVVTLGSFSKTYWGGLRTGWVRAPEGIIARLAAAKAAADLGSPPFQQAIVAALISSSHEEIVAYRADWARQRYAAIAAALTAFLPSWTWTAPSGGLTLWARRPGDADSGGFAQAALRRGVAVVPGRLLSVSAERSPWLRLAFTLPSDDLVTAVKALASV